MDVVGKVFGRKVPQEVVVDSVPAEFEKDVVEAKGIGYSTSSKYLFREIELFIPETIGMAISIMASVLLVVFGLLFNSPMFYIVAVAPLVLVLVLFWIARFLLFMPSKSRFVTARVLGTNQIRFSVDDVKAEIPFDKSQLSPKIKIINPKKHTDFKTGRPVIVMREGEGENVSIAPITNTSDQSRELANVIDSIWGTAEAYTRYNLKSEVKKLEMFLLLMCGLTVVLSLAAAYFGMQNQGSLTELIKAVAPQILK